MWRGLEFAAHPLSLVIFLYFVHFCAPFRGYTGYARVADIGPTWKLGRSLFGLWTNGI